MICNSLSMSVRTTRELDVPSTEASGWSSATASRDTEAFTDRPSLHPRAMSFRRVRADLAASIRFDVTEAIPSRGTLAGRVPAIQIHRRVRFEEAHAPGRLDSVLIRPAPLHHGKDQVRRAVQNPLERQDPDAAERLLKQVEHRGAVHHGPLVSEAESLRSGQFLEASVVVD